MISLTLLVTAKTITIHNDQPRLDINGDYVDAHAGNIVEHNGTYFLYGESYGEQTLEQQYPWPNYPKLKVYTSPDLTTWTDRGDPVPGWTATPTRWIPRVFFDAKTQRFVMWFGVGGWASATSTDGIHFTPSAHGIHYSRFGPASGVGGTSVFVDDDGTGYIAFTALDPGFDTQTHPGWPGCPSCAARGYGHIVSIEQTTDDYLASSKVNVSMMFPDDMVEAPTLFKNDNIYYLTYGSCCCGCKGGSGMVVWSAKSVGGPWTRQAPHSDVNCNDASAPICGGSGVVIPPPDWPSHSLVYDAQWWSPNKITLDPAWGKGDHAIIFLGRRWMSGPNAPAWQGIGGACGNGPAGGGPANYKLKSDYSVWLPLSIENGVVAPLAAGVDSFTLEVPDR